MSAPSDYRMSGISSDGRAIYHPAVFQQMVNDGVIDRRGYPLPAQAEPIWDYSKPPVTCEKIGWHEA